MKTGDRFGRLVVTGVSERRVGSTGRGRTYWEFVCDCGAMHWAAPHNVKSGMVLSCGCLAVDSLVERTVTHGRTGSPTYIVWAGMHARCCNPKHDAYPYYGGKGVAVCDRWQEFESFLADMGERPAGTQIDRIDNARGYEPDNCRWVTRSQQGRNRTNNVTVTVDGETACLAEWSERSGIDLRTIWNRLFTLKWSAKRAVTTPVRVRLSAEQARSIRARYDAGGISQTQLAREFGVGRTTIGDVLGGDPMQARAIAADLLAAAEDAEGVR
ncbi:MAG TPA: helix-turn-helix domain-containing protein [Polyangiaceae bacterium]|jgi:hypothetical protein|nr:helix-turn-helix domain-containing protein [Polyangiaceae bacterium]